MKTLFAKAKDISKKWYVVDADGAVLGRLASRVASILRGKNNPLYTPHVDTGDYVVVINARKVRLTGNKLKDKAYYHHTGYPGGIKKKTAGELMQTSPEKIIFSAVHGMLPKNKLGRKQLKKLKVYSGSDHPHIPQNPEPLTFRKQ
jgi:large subunit ribosomal protein L13